MKMISIQQEMMGSVLQTVEEVQAENKRISEQLNEGREPEEEGRLATFNFECLSKEDGK